MEKGNRPGVLFYFDIIPSLEQLPYDAVGKLLLAAFHYAKDGIEPSFEENALLFAWAFIKPSVDRDGVRYETRKAKGKWLAYCKQCKNDGINALDFDTWCERADNDTLRTDNDTLRTDSDTLPTTTSTSTTTTNNNKYIGTDEPSDEFDVFWKAYPKKKNKIDAKKAFAKVKVPLQTLLDAIERQKRSHQWQKDGGQYIPYPATWLNRGAWDDELEGEQYGSDDKPDGDDSEGPYRWHGYDLTPDVY